MMQTKRSGKLSLDVVLISDAKTESLRRITEKAIDTLGGRAHVFVVESNPLITYLGATVIYPETPFSYNAYLNLGARAGQSDYIFFGNNDLVFEADWDLELLKVMVEKKVASASPICPASHAPLGIRPNTGVLYGNAVFSRFCGWAYCWKRSLFNALGGFDEDFTFWCSDNATVEQLEKHKQQHILVTSSVVHHLGSGNNTINKLDRATVNKYTVQEIEKYNVKYNRDLRIDSSWVIPQGI